MLPDYGEVLRHHAIRRDKTEEGRAARIALRQACEAIGAWVCAMRHETGSVPADDGWFTMLLVTIDPWLDYLCRPHLGGPIDDDTLKQYARRAVWNSLASYETAGDASFFTWCGNNIRLHLRGRVYKALLKARERPRPVSVDEAIGLGKDSVLDLQAALLGYGVPRQLEDFLDVEALLGRLPERERTLLLRHSLGEESAKALGREVGLSDTGVMLLIKAAREALAAAMSPQPLRAALSNKAQRLLDHMVLGVPGEPALVTEGGYCVLRGITTSDPKAAFDSARGSDFRSVRMDGKPWYGIRWYEVPVADGYFLGDPGRAIGDPVRAFFGARGVFAHPNGDHQSMVKVASGRYVHVRGRQAEAPEGNFPTRRLRARRYDLQFTRDPGEV